MPAINSHGGKECQCGWTADSGYEVIVGGQGAFNVAPKLLALNESNVHLKMTTPVTSWSSHHGTDPKANLSPLSLTVKTALQKQIFRAGKWLSG